LLVEKPKFSPFSATRIASQVLRTDKHVYCTVLFLLYVVNICKMLRLRRVTWCLWSTASSQMRSSSPVDCGAIVCEGLESLAGRMIKCSLSVKVNNNRVREQSYFMLMIWLPLAVE